MSQQDTGFIESTLLSEPLAFRFSEQSQLYADQLSDEMGWLHDFVLAFAVSDTTTISSTIPVTLGEGRSPSDHVSMTSTFRQRNRVLIRSMSYNSPIEVVVDIPFPLIVTGITTAAVGSGIALLRFWQRFTKARVEHNEGQAAISRARTETLAWDLIREEIETDYNKSLSKKQKQRLRNAAKLAAVVDEIKAIEK